MALIKCKECKKEVSDKAKTCPHCGVKEPAIGVKQKVGGCLTLIVLVGLLAWWFSSGDDSKKEEGATTQKECSNTDAECLFKANLFDAAVKCRPLVERAAKFEYEWTDGVMSPMFTHMRNEPKENLFTFIGDEVKFTNGFNAKTVMTYSCTMNLKTKEITAFDIKQGRL